MGSLRNISTWMGLSSFRCEESLSNLAANVTISTFFWGIIQQGHRPWERKKGYGTYPPETPSGVWGRACCVARQNFLNVRRSPGTGRQKHSSRWINGNMRNSLEIVCYRTQWWFLFSGFLFILTHLCNSLFVIHTTERPLLIHSAKFSITRQSWMLLWRLRND